MKEETGRRERLRSSRANHKKSVNKQHLSHMLGDSHTQTFAQIFRPIKKGPGLAGEPNLTLSLPELGGTQEPRNASTNT
jgi:hypothetical protein